MQLARNRSCKMTVSCCRGARLASRELLTRAIVAVMPPLPAWVMLQFIVFCWRHLRMCRMSMSR